jgi:hypothetical protein
MHGHLLSDHDRAGTSAPRSTARPAGGGVAGMMTALQASAGNRAVQRAIASGGLTVPTIQREGCGGGSCGCASCGSGAKASEEDGGAAAGVTEA